MACQTMHDIWNGDLFPEFVKFDLGADVLDACEYIPIEEDGELKEREKSYLADGYDAEPEENWDWISKLRTENPEVL